MRFLLKLLVPLAFVAAAVWFYFTPHLVLHEMQEAAQAKDTGRFSQHVDYPTVKESIKAGFAARLGSPEQGDNPLAKLGKALAGAVLSPVVDALVTPEAVAAMLMYGQKPKAGAPAPAPAPEASRQPAAEKEVQYHGGYESFDHFVVTVQRRSAPQEPLGLVFQRHNGISWKLAAIRLSNT